MKTKRTARPSGTIGIELRGDVVRAVRLGGWKRNVVTVLEVPWNPDDVDGATNAATAIRIGLGPAERVSIAADLALLFVKRVRVPPLPAAEKRRIVSLEPDRFFAIRGDDDLVVAARDADNLVFAGRAPQLAAWASAFETVGPVERVEAAPTAVARALAAHGMHDAHVLMDDVAGGTSVVQVAGGAVRDARRVPAAAREAAIIDASPLPHRLGPVSGPYVAAYGTAIDAEAQREPALLPPELARRVVDRRRGAILRGVLACVAALALLVAAASAAQGRIDRRLDDEIAELRAKANAASDLEQEATRLGTEERAITKLEAGRRDVLDIMRAITALLPRDAHIRSLRWTGDEWQLDGRAANAARLVPLFENDPLFEGVRFTEPTSRVASREGTYESFSLALRVVRTP